MSVALRLALFIALNIVPDSSALMFKEGSFVPDVAPPMDQRKIDDAFYNLGGMTSPKSRLIQELFIGATYSDKCDPKGPKGPKDPKGPKVQMVYYNIGQRVDLPCIVCQRAAIYNGAMKHWKFLDIRDLENMLSLSDKNLMEDLFYTAEEYKTSKSKDTTTRYFQRNGRLTITHADRYAMGLYVCGDLSTSSSKDQFYYFLIPNSRLVKKNLEKTKGGNPNGHDLNDRHDEGVGEIYFDDDWMYNGISALYQDDSKFACKKDNTCQRYTPSKSTLPNVTSELELHYKSKVSGEGFDDSTLGVLTYVKWGPWTSCERDERRIRTRIGRCMLKLEDEDGSVNGDDWFQKWSHYTYLNAFMKFVPKQGVRFFNGVFGAIFEPRSDDSYMVYRAIEDHFLHSFEWKFAWRHGGEDKNESPDSKVAVRPSMHRCFYGLTGPGIVDDSGREFAIIGRDLFENQRCPGK